MTRPLPLLLLSLTLAACTQASAPTGPAAGTTSPPERIHPVNNASGKNLLGGYHWRLQDATDAQGRRIDALLVRPDQPVQFDVGDGRIRIANACNGISGDVRIEADGMTIGPLVSTKMACVDPAIMALDAEVGQRLQGKVRFALLESDPPQLVWTAANGDTLRFVGAPTPETRFRSPGETAYLEVAARSEPCASSGADASQQCLRVRELRYGAQGEKIEPPGEWRLFRDVIEGYSHEEGIRHVLRVKRFTPDDKPPESMADAKPVFYVLDLSIESESIGP